MDPLSGLFARQGAQPAFLLRTQMAAPFALELADGAPLSLVAAARGTLAIVHPAGTCILPPGAVALVRGEERWRIADSPTAPLSAVIHPGQRCETLRGEPLAARWSLGVRTWGASELADATHVLLTGTYEHVPESGRRLLDVLPGVLVVPAAAADPTLLAWFAAEIARDELAQDVVLERMLDLLVVLAIRHWMEATPSLPVGLLRGLADREVGGAIRRMQAAPARRWTVAALAREVGLSRAAFSRRFSELVGTAPIAFLTEWRLALAADRLAGGGDALATIAEDVGYGSAFAFSTAFKRRYGTSPHRYRTGAPPTASGIVGA